MSNTRRNGALKTSAVLASALAATLLLAACGGEDSADGTATSGTTDRSSSAAPADPAAAKCDRNKEAGKIVYISGYGYSASAGQMDVFLAKELGYYDDLCLEVEINASGANGQQLVAAGQAQFTALGSASDVMLAAANSKNLTAVATYGDRDPFSIFTNEKIKSLKDLEGGTLGYFINMTPIASATLDAAGVDVDKVELVKMTNYDPTVVTRGQVDAVVGYASNQPQTLKAMGESFNEFFPSDFDVAGTYNVMEVNTQWYKENPEVTADFMRGTLKAMEHCLANSDECLDILAQLAVDANQGDAFPREQLARTWAVESQWVKDSKMGPPGVQTAAAWEGEYELVKKYGGIDELPAIADMMDPNLVAGLYDGDTLIWPGE